MWANRGSCQLGEQRGGSGSRASSLVSALPAGLSDASFASLGTFAAGLAGVNLLSDVDRGVYAVFVAAFLVATVVPQNIVYLPAQVVAVAQPLAERLNHIARTLRLGVGPSLLGASMLLVAAVVTSGNTTRDVTIALLVTAAVNVVLSTGQDFTRRMLHIGGRHWDAALVSVLQFCTVLGALGSALLLDIPPAWMPYGSLAIANGVTTVVGLARLGRRAAGDVPADLSLRTLARSGRWLLVQALIPSGAAFLAAAIITALAGAVAMGYAESARVAAQPVLVVATGLTSVLTPRVMGSAMSGAETEGRRELRRFTILVGGAGLAYLAVAGGAWPWNPMEMIVPSAYVVPGLVALTIIANIIVAGLFLRVEELTGARREVGLARVSAAGAPALIGVALTAGLTGAYARPLGLIAWASIRAWLYARYRAIHYGEFESS